MHCFMTHFISAIVSFKCYQMATAFTIANITFHSYAKNFIKLFSAIPLTVIDKSVLNIVHAELTQMAVQNKERIIIKLIILVHSKILSHIYIYVANLSNINMQYRIPFQYKS